MPSQPAVSVIIAARDAAPTLERSLQALRAQEADFTFEVIVVDDGSRDETPRIAARHSPAVTVVRNEPSRGPGGARNRGVEAANAPILAFTDADCFPASRWLAEGVRALKDRELVQGRVLPDPALPRTPFDRSVTVEGDGGFYQTANLFVRRAVFADVGGFRDWALERRRRWAADRRRARAMRTPIGEDTLFAWTARRRGARSVFAPDAIVHHAVVPGRLTDAIADRWHWTRDMPGLARLVPELRERTFHRRYFFARWSAQFDLAVAGGSLAVATRSRIPLAIVLPYAARLVREADGYRDGTRQGTLHGLAFLFGQPVVDAATLAGFLVGSLQWRSVVI